MALNGEHGPPLLGTRTGCGLFRTRSLRRPAALSQQVSITHRGLVRGRRGQPQPGRASFLPERKQFRIPEGLL